MDERRFLLQLLARLYQTWPTTTDPAQLNREVAEHRHRCVRLHEHVKSAAADTPLPALYGDLVSSVDAAIEFLANQGTIERDAIARADHERFEAGGRAAETGLRAAGMSSEFGSSGGDAAAVGLIAGLVRYAIEDSAQERSRDNAKAEAIARAARDVDNRISVAIARAETAGRSMASRYGWPRGDVVFRQAPERLELVKDLVARGDIGGLARLVDQDVARSPRDPFVLGHRIVGANDRTCRPDALLKISEDCVIAATLVPAGQIYDEYRANFLYLAGGAALRAASLDDAGRNLGWVGARTQAAMHSLRLSDASLKYAAGDPTGEVREQRAWTLASCGRAPEAVQQAEEVRPQRVKTVRYAYGMACLQSMLNQPDVSLQWLDYAVRTLGWNDVAHARIDPDLTTLRTRKAEEFQLLTTPTVTWDIQWGILNDDVVLTNTSGFALTNVVLDVRAESAGKVWTPQLKAERILPNQTFKWVDVFSIPGSRVDRKSATFLCDQSR